MSTRSNSHRESLTSHLLVRCRKSDVDLTRCMRTRFNVSRLLLAALPLTLSACLEPPSDDGLFGRNGGTSVRFTDIVDEAKFDAAEGTPLTSGAPTTGEERRNDAGPNSGTELGARLHASKPHSVVANGSHADAGQYVESAAPASDDVCTADGCRTGTVPNLLVAFIGDQGNNGNSDAVLQLIAGEGADAVVHNGDFDYKDNPDAWDDRINRVLGPDYPYFSIIGNHDALAWHGSNGYAAKIAERHDRIPEMQCSGELGVRANCTFRGLHLVESCIGTDELRAECERDSPDQLEFIRSSLANSSAIFKVCNWHKNQHDMQVGAKKDTVGWKAYRTCMNAGAMVATGHEHSYARTLTLTDVGNAATGHGAVGLYSHMELAPKRNFVIVSGLAGVGLRLFDPGHTDDTWWASYYAKDRWLMNGTLMPGGANYGALFIEFHVDGDPSLARGYFKDVSGRIADSFTIQVE